MAQSQISLEKLRQFFILERMQGIAKLNKIPILLYFPYKTLGEVKIQSFVQEISSYDKSDSTFLC
jgi:hypothetical protein